MILHSCGRDHSIVLQYVDFSNAYAYLTKIEERFRMLCSSMLQVDDRNLVAAVSMFCEDFGRKLETYPTPKT